MGGCDLPFSIWPLGLAQSAVCGGLRASASQISVAQGGLEILLEP